MKTLTTFFLCLITFCVSIFLYALKHEYLIIRLPGYHYGLSNAAQGSSHKKVVALSIRSHNTWKTDQQEILWTNDAAENTRLLLTSWLLFVQEEYCIEKKITVQDCALSASGQDIYISFSHNPLPQDVPIITKWLLVESILKTLRDNKIPVTNSIFLVQHQPLQDAHVSFDLPWPVNGFFE